MVRLQSNLYGSALIIIVKTMEHSLTKSLYIFVAKTVKAVWKNLRTVFSRECVKCVARHSGDEGGDLEDDLLYTGDWALFHHMKFLLDTMRPRPTTGSLDPIVDSGADTAQDDSSMRDTSGGPSHIQNEASYLEQYII